MTITPEPPADPAPPPLPVPFVPAGCTVGAAYVSPFPPTAYVVVVPEIESEIPTPPRFERLPAAIGWPGPPAPPPPPPTWEVAAVVEQPMPPIFPSATQSV